MSNLWLNLIMNMCHWILFCLTGIDLLVVFIAGSHLYSSRSVRKTKTDSMFSLRISLSQQVDGVLGERRPVSVLSVSPWDWGLESLKIPGFRDTDSNTPTQSFVEFILKNTLYCLCFIVPKPSDQASLLTWTAAFTQCECTGLQTGVVNAMSCLCLQWKNNGKVAQWNGKTHSVWTAP